MWYQLIHNIMISIITQIWEYRLYKYDNDIWKSRSKWTSKWRMELFPKKVWRSKCRKVKAIIVQYLVISRNNLCTSEMFTWNGQGHSLYKAPFRRVCHWGSSQSFGEKEFNPKLNPFESFWLILVKTHLCKPMSSSPLPIFTCKSSECSFGDMSTAFLGLSSILVIKSDTSRRSCHLIRNSWRTLDPWWAVSWASDCFCNLANSSAAGFPPEKPTNQNMTRMNRHQDVSGVFSKAANFRYIELRCQDTRV